MSKAIYGESHPENTHSNKSLNSDADTNIGVKAHGSSAESGASKESKKNNKPSCSCDAEDEEVHASGDHGHDHASNGGGHSHEPKKESLWKVFSVPLFSLVLLLTGLYLDQILKPDWFSGVVRILFYVIAYVPVGLPVLEDAVSSIRYGDFFSEFFLMGIATIGAFAIGEYPEGVAVMLFYSVGEAFQGMAVSKAKGNISKLLDSRPDTVRVQTDKGLEIRKAKEVSLGSIIELKPGDLVALDGTLLSDSASFNTSALTGESRPDTKRKGEEVLAGMVNLSSPILMQVSREYADSKLSKILELVREATKNKAPTELFIRKFSKIYTPIVVFLAIGITLIPALIVPGYVFSEWLYRALVFLVISCPCALVISIPLGYFGGIGAASRNGILVKGSVFLDDLASTTHVVMDKTGTLTKGDFKVTGLSLEPFVASQKADVLALVKELESKSSHPVAQAVVQHLGEYSSSKEWQEIEEIPGHGMKGITEGKSLLVGNFKLLEREGVAYDPLLAQSTDTLVAIALDQKFAGFIRLGDELKEEAKDALSKLHQMKLKTVILSGDKSAVVQRVASELGVNIYYGDLLPEDKVKRVENLRGDKSKIVFVGDGVNDAPVLALSDVGMAMGGLGSDAAIETADIVIQDDKVTKIPISIKIGKETKKIVWQNVAFAFGVKALVLLLGAWGVASMWEAVFADVGVALLAILNAVRIQNMKFRI